MKPRTAALIILSLVVVSLMLTFLTSCECRLQLDSRANRRPSTPPESLYEPKPYNLMEDMSNPANPLSPLSPINPASPLYSPTLTWQQP
jgi:hypothetical protein